MPELGTSGSVRGRDGQPPGLLDRKFLGEAYLVPPYLQCLMLLCGAPWSCRLHFFFPFASASATCNQWHKIH